MIYNIDFEIAAVVFLSFLYAYFRIQYETDTHSNTAFKRTVIALIVAASLDSITAVTISYTQNVPVWLNNALNAVFFVFASGSIYCMVAYIRSMLGLSVHTFDKINLGIYIVHSLLCITSPFTKLIFYFDENKVYTHGLLYYAVYAIPSYFMIFSIIKIIKYRSRISVKQFISILVAMFFCELGTMLQMIVFQEFLLTYFTTCLAVVVLLFVFETPDYQKLVKTRKDLEKALKKAEEANKAKTAFLSNMSHDIRTPMNAIVGYTSLALDHVNEPEDVTNCLNTIRSSSNHLLALINNVLDMSRIESGKAAINPKSCDLLSLLNEISQILAADFSKKNITFVGNFDGVTDKYVITDHLRINQILLNCLGNSVKFTKEGGTVNFTVTQEKNKTGKIVNCTFKITDNGIGMSKDFLSRIYEPFERDHKSMGDNIQGSGLGMSITQKIVKAMGGSINVSSELGEGTQTIIVIPMKLDVERASAHTAVEEKESTSINDMLIALKGKRFMVVDDNTINRTVVSRLLTERGMEVLECSSGEEALEKLEHIKEGDFDMIFMDIQMPGIDGYETTDKLREMPNPVLKAIPILAMTANAFDEDKDLAFEHGMCGHIAKPFSPDTLVETLYNILM